MTEDAVLSFFVSEDGLLQKGCSYKKNISTVFKVGLKWKRPQCRRILGFLPLLRKTRKIYGTLHRMKLGPAEGGRGQRILCPQQISYPPAPFYRPAGLQHYRPYIRFHRLGKRTDTGRSAGDIRAGRDSPFCCCCHFHSP